MLHEVREIDGAASGKAPKALGSTATASSIDRPPIVVTASDHECLSAFLRTVAMESDATEYLREELNRADIIRGEVSARNLVMIGSNVKFVDESSTIARTAKLVPPQMATDGNSISVASALGTALIGLGPGQSIRWWDGKTVHRTTVLEIS